MELQNPRERRCIKWCRSKRLIFSIHQIKEE
nr:MAG TPA: hypothetical protein [Caudoviricetes sp.]